VIGQWDTVQFVYATDRWVQCAQWVDN
jgi:hypothetical protein